METPEPTLTTGEESFATQLDTIINLRKQLSQFQDLESRFKAVADNAPVLVWMSETDKLCTYFNKGWLEYTGRTMEQEYGNGWAEGVHPDDFDSCLEIYVTSFDKREPFTMEYRLKRHDGQYRWILDNGVPRYSPEGEFLGYIGSCIDIHNQKTINKQLEAHNIKLSRKNAELKAFNYIATYDLQEPLRRITNFSELLTSNFSEAISPVVNGYLHKIKEEVSDMQSLINSLLEYTLLNDDRHWREKTDLNELLKEAIKSFSDEITSKNVKIRADRLPTLNVVPAHIRRVFVNLISNSLRFARIGVVPTIVISATKVISGARINRFLKEEPYWEIDFSDNGVGFEDKYRDLVFELFQRVGDSKNHGAGVGLAIAKKIMLNHDGEIFATSRPDEGSTFRLYFPEN